MIDRRDDFPHSVPVEALMTWKENWVFPAVDADARVASLFHISLRPRRGEGIFTAKFCLDGFEHRYVGRSPIPRDVETLRPVADERLSFEVVEPLRRFRIRYRSDELSADISYRARFPVYDFADGPKAPGESELGEIGRSVFPYHHREQSLFHEGVIEVHAGPRAGETFELAGYACRDHSWGWREDLAFQYHHWVCASFDDRFVEGSVMREDFYPDGPKHGGWISTAAGNDPVRAVDTSGSCDLDDNDPLPALFEDVTYRVETVGGEVATVVAHLGDDYGRLYLDARSPDRATVYQDVQIFCDYTLLETGQRGSGVLELGKRARGPGIGEDAAYRSGASRR